MQFFFVWLLLPTHRRFREWQSYLITLYNIHHARQDLSDEESARRTDLYLATLTKDRHQCPRRDSNLQSQQPNDGRPTPHTALPPGSALPSFINPNILPLFSQNILLSYLNLILRYISVSVVISLRTERSGCRGITTCKRKVCSLMFPKVQISYGEYPRSAQRYQDPFSGVKQLGYGTDHFTTVQLRATTYVFLT